MRSFIYGNIRVQLLDADIVRLEYGKRGKFCDENTLHIPQRSQFADTDPVCRAEGNTLEFGDYRLTVPENARSLGGIRLEKQGKRVYAYKKQKNSGELPLPWETPEVFSLSDDPRVTLPEAGYTGRGRRKNSGYRIREAVQDVYLLLCRKDARRLRQLYVRLTGAAELVRLATLGSWNSKYYAYTEETAKQLILDYEKYNVPLDNMVIDTDWRAATERGIGYDLNTRLFPDMGRFLRFAHAHGVEVMFNDHPEPVEGARDLLDPAESSYREEKLQGLLKLGVDTWWYDRNWHTKLKSPTAHIPPETWGMYIFADITRHFYEKQAKSREVYRRPVIMANVDNIANGRYFGIADSASHRFSIQWTGDIYSHRDSLTQEVENMLRCGCACIPYANADCGGHLGDPDKEEFIRWMQFGTLSPVFRPHATNFVKRFREPWLYDAQTLEIVRHYNFLRYRLLPVIYREAFDGMTTGLPIFRPMALAFPGWKKDCWDQYMLGENILISPIAGARLEKLGERDYVTPVKAQFYAGTEPAGTPIWETEYPELKMSACAEPLGPGLPASGLSARFETTVRFASDRMLYLQCDDGAKVWVNGQKVAEAATDFSAMNLSLGLYRAGEPCHIVVEYFQRGQERVCSLCSRAPEAGKKQVILPQGTWMDAFTGKTYRGGGRIARDYGLEEMPLFIRMGAVVPLAYAARNTRQQSWEQLVYDCYPGETGDEGYLYEDDGETTAYRLGRCRTSRYAAGPREEGYSLTLFGAQGEFAGSRACEDRTITVKYHCRKGFDRVKKVTVNGLDTPFTRVKKAPGTFPLNTCPEAGDSDVVLVRLRASVKEALEIRFCME